MKQIAMPNMTFSETNISNYFKSHIALCNLVKVTPFRWNSKEEKLEVKAKRWKTRFYFAFAVHLIIFLFEIVESVHAAIHVENGSLSLSGVLERCVFLALQCGGILYCIQLHYHAGDMTMILNELLHKFEQMGIGKLKCAVIEAVMVSVIVVTVSTPVVFGILLLCLPQTPPFPTSFLMKLVSGSLEMRMLCRMTVFFISIIHAWNATFWVIHGYLIVTIVFLSYATIYIGIGSLKRSHSSLPDRFKKYRYLQLSTCHANLCFQNTIAFWWTCIIITITVFGLTSSIRYQDMSLEFFAICLVFTGQTLAFTIVGYKFLGKMNWVSVDVKMDWKRDLRRSNKYKEYLRQILSFPDIKIKLGATNYFERATSLVISDFNIENAISLTLLMK